MIRFSIIIPVYNRVRYLNRLFESLSAQRYRPIEIILVDNGSTDASLSVCMDFARRHAGEADFKVKVLSAPERRGACYARNRGAACAGGDYLYFFDSDDELSPCFFQLVAEVIQKNSAPDVVAARTLLVAADRVAKKRKVYHTASVSDQILTGMLSTQSMVLAARFYREMGGWNEALPRWNDWEFGIRVLLYRPVLHWMEGTYHRIHLHADSITGTSFSESAPALYRAICTVRGELVEARDRKALWYRQTILAAFFRREHSDEWATRLLAEAVGQCASRFERMKIRGLYAYLVCGGRGAWLLARWLLG